MKLITKLSENIVNENSKNEVAKFEKRINNYCENIINCTCMREFSKTCMSINKDLEALEIHSFYLDYDLMKLKHDFSEYYQSLVRNYFDKLSDVSLMLEEYKRLPYSYVKEYVIDYVKTLLIKSGVSINELNLQYNDEAFDDGIKSENIDDLNAEEFEDYCVRLLVKNSFIGVEHTVDKNAIDIIAYKNGKRYAIDCKCYSAEVDKSVLEELYEETIEGGYDFKVVLTNNNFSKEAIAYSKQKDITLWDKEVLTGFEK